MIFYAVHVCIVCQLSWNLWDSPRFLAFVPNGSLKTVLAPFVLEFRPFLYASTPLHALLLAHPHVLLCPHFVHARFYSKMSTYRLLETIVVMTLGFPRNFSPSVRRLLQCLLESNNSCYLQYMHNHHVLYRKPLHHDYTCMK